MAKSKLTAPSAPPVIDPNASQSQSNPAASKPTTTAQDDDGWVVQSASTGMTATAEELKARSETVKVTDPTGRRDVRPGAKDSLNPDPAAPTKKEEAPVGEQPRGPDGKFAKKEEAPAGEQPGEQPGEAAVGEKPAGEGEKKPLPPRLPGETRDQYRSRIRRNIVQNQIDDATFKRQQLERENAELERQLAEKRRALADPAAPKKEEPEAPAIPPAAEDPKPTWAAYRDQGKSWDDYTEASAAWEDRDYERRSAALEQRVAGRARQDVAVQQRAQAFAGRVAVARAEHPDFDDVVGNLTMENTPFIARLLGNHPQGAELMYHLGQQPDLAADLAELTQPVDLGGGRLGMHPSHAPIMEALMTSPDPQKLLATLLDPEAGHFERIAGLQGALALREILKLEGSQAPAPAGSGNGRPPAEPKTKTAAPPLRPPSGAAAAGTEIPASEDGEDLPFGPEYVRRQNELNRQRGRRF